MSSILIVYGSTIGNTEFVAEEISRAVLKAGHRVKLASVAGLDASGLCAAYDFIFFGCSTWGVETIELQDDFVDFFENFGKIEAKGKLVAVFGCGDTSYTYYCGAVDLISERLEELGAKVLDKLKIDGDPVAEKDEIAKWTNGILEKL